MSKNKTAIQLSDHFTMERLLRFAAPSIIMMIFTAIYGVVDGLFVSNFAGKTPFAAINLIMPFIVIFQGTGFMIGAGGTALVSMVMGTGDEYKANRYFTMLIIFTVILAASLAVIGFALTPAVAEFFGASQEMMDDCILYSRICMCFIFAFMLQNDFQMFFVCAEKPKLGLAFTVAAGLTNIVGDAVLVGLLHLGVAGAALATGLSQCVGGVLPLFYFRKGNRHNNSRLHFERTRLEFIPIVKTCTNGVSEFLGNISSSIVSALYNFQLMRLYGEDGVSAYGVIMYVQFIFVSIFCGFSSGVGPIMSYDYGASNESEMKNLFRKCVSFTIIAGACMLCLGELLSSTLATIFVGRYEDLCRLTTMAFRVYALHFVVVGFNIYASGLFTSLNNGAISGLISALRTLVFQVGAVLLLPVIFGAEGIWWAVIVAETAASILSLGFIIGKRKRYGYI